MSTTAPAWLTRYLPDAPATGLSWSAQLEATDAEVAALEAERLRKTAGFKEGMRPTHAQTPRAVYMRQWREKRLRKAQAMGLAKPPGYR